MSREALDAALQSQPMLRDEAAAAHARLQALIATLRPLADEAARRAPADPDLLYRVRMLEHAARELEDILG
jgi:hypothetical protein